MKIDWAKVETMTPEDIENLRVELIKELQVVEENHQIVKQEYLNKGKDIIKLEGEKKDLQINLSQSAYTIRQRKSDLGILETKFWQSRR